MYSNNRQGASKGRVSIGACVTGGGSDGSEEEETEYSSNSGEMMSVFTDFQTAWVSRFPGCELPRAWEDDVRGNLTKHKQKVSVLKEKLEKEEFYVEYLERLLADVERVRAEKNVLQSSQPPSSTSATTATVTATTTPSFQATTTATSSGSNDLSASPVVVEEYATASVNNSTTNLNDQAKECSTTAGGDQYVTVINVSSYAESISNKNKPPVAAPRDIDSKGGLIENPLYQDINVNHVKKNKAMTAENELAKDSGSNGTRASSAGCELSSSFSPTSSVGSKVQQLQGAAVVVGAESKNGGAQAQAASGAPLGGQADKKKRPPTPPRKPKINRNNFPGLQFMNKDSFGRAVIVPSPTPPASAGPGTPNSEIDEPAQELPIITSCSEVVEIVKPIASKTAATPVHHVQQQQQQQLQQQLPPSAPHQLLPARPPLAPEEPAYAVGLLSEIEHGSGSIHSLASVDFDTQRLDENGSRVGYKSEEEASVNEDLSLHGVTDDREDGEADEEAEEEEAIYDTVAPDDANSLDSRLNGSGEENDINNLSKDGLLRLFCEKNSSASNLSSAKYSDINSFANYVNIDYFLRREETSSKTDSDDNETQMSQSISSDHEIDHRDSREDIPSSQNGQLQAKVGSGVGLAGPPSFVLRGNGQPTYDEVFHDPDLYGAYYGVVDSEPGSPNESTTMAKQSQAKLTSEEQSRADAERLAMTKCIVTSITESETAYVDCLNTLLQYMKAIKSTIGTTHPLVSPEDLSVMFYKITDLHSIHCAFLDGLKKLSAEQQKQGHRNGTASRSLGLVGVGGVDGSDENPTLGDLFKNLASRLGAYSAYLKNYSRALETVQKCSAENNQFSEITRAIKLKSMKGQATTLEELLHKPVARVQKNALVLHDLLKYTPESHAEHKSLRTALKMTQCFLNDLNIAATEQMFPPIQDKTQRRLVKESFIIESVENRRKLRHLFLFNDIIVCAKYRPSSRQRFTFDVKWYAMLCDITIPESEEPTTVTSKEKDMNTEIMSLKSRVSSLRDTMAKEEKAKANNKVFEKFKKKQAELESQLVLILPQLALVFAHRGGKNYTFFLSSEYEKTQWIESVKVLQQTAAASATTSSTATPGHHHQQHHHQQQAQQPAEAININELQAWIETCRKGLSPNLGSFLLRSSKDEELLNGDLYLEIRSLKGLSRPADLFFAVEVDIYGHYFQKAQTRTARETLEPLYNQEFVLDLDGSQTLRILCYEEVPGHSKPLFRGKANIELSRSWVTDRTTEKDVSMLDSVLSIKLRFVSSEASTIRFPAGKVYGSFGNNIQTVCKKEKSAIPYLIIGCVREVERRGVKELGIYRVSGLSSDVQKLKKAFETNPYEAEHLLKDIDIHAVTGLLKMYLRELPEALFTNSLYKKFFDAFSLTGQEEKKRKLVALFTQLPQVNQNTITFLIEHLMNVNQYEGFNKMSLNNLATVFGPTMIRPGSSNAPASAADQFTAGTIDVMAQAGILYFFLRRKVSPTETPC